MKLPVAQEQAVKQGDLFIVDDTNKIWTGNSVYLYDDYYCLIKTIDNALPFQVIILDTVTRRFQNDYDWFKVLSTYGVVLIPVRSVRSKP